MTSPLRDQGTLSAEGSLEKSFDIAFDSLCSHAGYLADVPGGAFFQSGVQNARLYAPAHELFELFVWNIVTGLWVHALAFNLYVKYFRKRTALLHNEELETLKRTVARLACHSSSEAILHGRIERILKSPGDREFLETCVALLERHGWPKADARSDVEGLLEKLRDQLKGGLRQDEGCVWLHLTDLHRGQPGDSGRWPTVQEALLADMERMAQQLGPPDLLLLTGDLAFAGAAEEYDAVDESLQRILEAVAGDPFLVVVPGNHDMTRPEGDPLGFQGYHQVESACRRNFLRGEASTLAYLRGLFHGYDNWWKRTVAPNWSRHAVTFTEGRLPGDFIVSVERGGLRLGLVGLNSAFLQQAGGDFARRLSVEPEQLPSELARWCQRQDASFLLMHHPPDWLHEQSLELFEQYIYPPERFTACFFGHMHQGRYRAESGSAGLTRRWYQGSSLFGLEHYGTQREQREMGYSWGRLRRTEGARGLMERWPRKALRRDDGSLEVDRDPAVREHPHRVEVPLRAPEAASPAGRRAR